MGISAQGQEKLLSHLFRAASVLQAQSRGADLGLHITRSLVELHGGRVCFESELDRGSTFYVTFPIADQPE